MGEFVERNYRPEPKKRTKPRSFVQTTLINPTGELPAPLPGFAANFALNEMEGSKLTEVDEQSFAAHGTQLAGHFLIDRQGIIRWAHVEAERTPTDIGRFPGEEEILAALASLPR